ncbi:hypothetical protein [Archangium sp.]|uniref:hypothetical protein n=1 Tax=Archangium sp. TaxID=1872627 RepID=UPI00286C7D79|nr:hypothetical protein [Archangium sp.]
MTSTHLVLLLALLTTGCVSPRALCEQPPRAKGPAGCGGQAVPPGWPDFSSGDREALLAPFLLCDSPAEFLALQQHVDMPRLVEALDDWRAVRLGAQGPLREDAAGPLNRKRVSILVEAPEAYGALNAEVLALYVVDSAHDDDLRELLFLLARDKRLEETLALLPAFQLALEKRGLKPTARPDREFEVGDVGRGLARAGRDALSSSPMSGDGAAFAFSPIRGQLPPRYQAALAEAQKRWAARHFSAGNVVLGGVDHLTFGVPLGFYGLLASTGQGVRSLAHGKYEQATRELAPAALLVALYAGGKGGRSLSEGRLARGMGPHLLTGLELMESRLRALQDTARRLEGLLGVEGLRELARDIQASREAGRFVAVGGVDAALALRAARGNVAEARALMSKARPESAAAGKGGMGRSSAAVASPEGLASLVDEGAGLTREVVDAKLALAEVESTGPRLTGDVAVLEKQRPALDAPPSGARDTPRWGDYVAYYEGRLGELRQGKAAKAPLRWDAYERMWGGFSRGLAFEHSMVALLEADALLPRAQRRFLGDFHTPRIERYVGVSKPESGLRYADVLIIEAGELAGRPRRVETLSFKSRDFSGLSPEELSARMKADAREALRKYGETLDIRRESLHVLLREGSEVPVSRVRLVYDGGEGGKLKPRDVNELRDAVQEAKDVVPGVEVLFQ